MSDRKVSIEELLKKIGLMTVQLDVASETVEVLRAEIERLRSEKDSEAKEKPTKK